MNAVNAVWSTVFVSIFEEKFSTTDVSTTYCLASVVAGVATSEVASAVGSSSASSSEPHLRVTSLATSTSSRGLCSTGATDSFANACWGRARSLTQSSASHGKTFQ